MPELVPGSLAEALAALQGQLPRVAKEHKAKVETKEGRGYTYDYADLTDVTAAIMPLLSALGLSFTACPTMHDGHFVLHYTLRFGTQGIDGIYPLPGSGSPQDIGKAITYARRYALCAVTGLAPGGDDDDGKSATEAHEERQQLPRTGTNADLRAAGRMDRQQKAAHEQLAADTQRDPKRAEHSYPRGPDLEDPWAADAPVDHERAAQLRADLDDPELPEDKPNTATPDQLRQLGIDMGKKGITDKEDRLMFCWHVTGRQVRSSRELSYNEAVAVLKAAGDLEVTGA